MKVLGIILDPTRLKYKKKLTCTKTNELRFVLRDPLFDVLIEVQAPVETFGFSLLNFARLRTSLQKTPSYLHRHLSSSVERLYVPFEDQL